ncbi:hypothetical protein [Herpetosiphon llansteffanensis]|uniref:hypothetical protein n=1 Tax=Herpetosiphon llansteffanensis TaxID=2094568 RepID=UPI000D7BF896|nr:hypothetical protein [Herpetosiphon llansteffanensis]
MRWYYVGILLFGLVSGCTSERDRVAPIVIPNVVADLCVLSPSHRYVIAHTYNPDLLPNDDHPQIQLFDLTTTLAITIPLAPEAYPDERLSLTWYPDDVLLVEDRWLYDIHHNIITDTTTLPKPLPPTPYQFDVPQWNPSPDGRYVASGAKIWERDPVTGGPGTIVIDLPNESYTEGCYNAWSADSRSYYFLDWETVGPRQSAPGPIRKITLP